MAAYIGRRYVLETLMGEFRAVCKCGSLGEINAFHTERIMKEPAFNFEAYENYPTNIPEYSRFMGSVYCSLENLPGPVSTWFLHRATEIHRLY
jgi:hypothetical protein